MLQLRRENIARVPGLSDPAELHRWQEILKLKLKEIFAKRPKIPGTPPAAADAISARIQESKKQAIRSLERKIRIMETDASLRSAASARRFPFRSGKVLSSPLAT